MREEEVSVVGGILDGAIVRIGRTYVPEHCVHATGLGNEQYCCLCGAVRYPPMEDVSYKHGPYLRGQVYEEYRLWTDACPNALPAQPTPS